MTKQIELPAPLPGEPPRWYARLCDFCLAGSSRTLDSTWRAATKGSKGQRAPGSWLRACEQWKWRARAAEYDNARHRQQAVELDNERREERARRRRVIGILGDRLEDLLADDAGASPLALAGLARVYLAASAEDFGATSDDLPVQTPTVRDLSPSEERVLFEWMSQCNALGWQHPLPPPPSLIC